MTSVPRGAMVSCGRNERLNTVPLPELPPPYAVPYRALPNKINPADGDPPSLQSVRQNSWSVAKPVPSVRRANTVPAPELPPLVAVPYRVLPDKINPASGFAPSLLVKSGPGVALKLCRFAKPVPSALTENTVPKLELPPPPAVPYSVLPDELVINPAAG